MRTIRSRDNPLLVQLRRVARDGASYRRSGEVWLEGDHLGDALRRRGGRARLAVVAESAWDADARLRELAAWAEDTAVVADALLGAASGLESPPRIGFLAALPAPAAVVPGVPSLVLDRLQDPGNAGSILRSAAAFGLRQVLARPGTVALWSPKVLRAAMGAHFGLAIVEGAGDAALEALALPLVATSSHAGVELPRASLPAPCAWVFGHEGQGVDAALAARCALAVRIPQPGGEESLNVAAAAAVCFYESARRAQ